MDQNFWKELIDLLSKVPKLSTRDGRDVWLGSCVPSNITNYMKRNDFVGYDLYFIITYIKERKSDQGEWYIIRLVEDALESARGIDIAEPLKDKLDLLRKVLLSGVVVSGPPIPLNLNIFLEQHPNCCELFGQKELVMRITQHILAESDDKTTVLVLRGQARTGKSTLLKSLKSHLKEPCIPILIDMQGVSKSNFSDSIYYIANIIWENFDAWAHRRSIFMPKPKYSAYQSNAQEAFNEYWLSIQRSAGNTPLVVIMDELEVLAPQSRAVQFLEILVKNTKEEQQKSAANSRTCFILVGSEKVDATEYLDFNQLIKGLIKNYMPKTAQLASEDARWIHYLSDTDSSKFWRFVELHFHLVNGSLDFMQKLCDGQIWVLDKLFEIVCHTAREMGWQSLIQDSTSIIDETLTTCRYGFQQFAERLNESEQFVLNSVSELWENYLDIPQLPLGQMFDLAESTFSEKSEVILQGLNDLEKREWVERVSDKKFRFRFGIILVWWYRYQYPLSRR